MSSLECRSDSLRLKIATYHREYISFDKLKDFDMLELSELKLEIRSALQKRV